MPKRLAGRSLPFATCDITVHCTPCLLIWPKDDMLKSSLRTFLQARKDVPALAFMTQEFNLCF